MVFGPHILSDGTLRFICLATLFLQPPDQMPATIVLDEPELGLHPYAIVLLAEMVRSAAEHTQVIMATQSVTLVNQFSPPGSPDRRSRGGGLIDPAPLP
jgi:predicted ATPase